MREGARLHGHEKLEIFPAVERVRPRIVSRRTSDYFRRCVHRNGVDLGAARTGTSEPSHIRRYSVRYIHHRVDVCRSGEPASLTHARLRRRKRSERRFA